MKTVEIKPTSVTNFGEGVACGNKGEIAGKMPSPNTRKINPALGKHPVVGGIPTLGRHD